MTHSNTDLNRYKIYRDKHEALSIAGQIKPKGKMQDPLDEEASSGLARKSRSTDKHDSLFFVKYLSLGHNKPIHLIVKKQRNE
jgi:hypothetical protein